MIETMEVSFRSAIGRQYRNEDISRPDGSMNLLVDIAEALSIPKGESRRLPTPIHLKGNGHTVALLDVAAGRRPGSDEPVGQFMIPPIDQFRMVEVLVVNESGGSLMIQPNYSLGTLSFMVQERADALEQHHDTDEFRVEVVFAPKHFDTKLKPSYGSQGAAGIDLRADVEAPIDLQPGERLLIQTGLTAAIPEGFEGQVRPRSGLALKHGISVTNSPGTVDSDYRGPIGVILHNMGQQTFRIEPGERIAQLVFAPVMTATLDFRDVLGESDRGSGGFGSTGRS